MSDTPPAHPRPVPTLLDLLIAFCLISLSGFGGVLYWSRRMMVEERKWLTADEFNEAYALCNFLPGPNIVNFSVVFGRQIAGTVGAPGGAGGITRAAVPDRHFLRHPVRPVRHH